MVSGLRVGVGVVVAVGNGVGVAVGVVVCVATGVGRAVEVAGAAVALGAGGGPLHAAAKNARATPIKLLRSQCVVFMSLLPISLGLHNTSGNL